MNIENRVDEFFLQRNWTRNTTKDDKLHLFNVVGPSRTIFLTYTLKDLPRGYSIFSLAEIIEVEFSKLFSTIYQDNENRKWPIDVKNFSCKLDHGGKHSDSLLLFEKEIMDWSASVDSNEKIEEFSQSRPDNNLIAQVWHLVALSQLEQYQQLMKYQDAFTRENRLNFLPGITKAMIDSALEHSVRNL